MLYFRVVKTNGNSRFVQVYRYQNRKRVIVKHIGSSTNQQEIESLVEMARLYISEVTKQSYLFEDIKPKEDAILLSQCNFRGVYYTFFYDVVKAIQLNIGYNPFTDTL